jgi:hypothetical protein
MVKAMTTLLSIATAATVASALLLAGSVLLSVPALSESGQAGGTAAKGDLLVPRARIADAPRYVIVETRSPGVSVLERVPARVANGAPRVARLKSLRSDASDLF